MENTTAIIAILIAILVAVALLNAALLVLFLRRRRAAEQPDTGFRLLLDQLNELSRTMDAKLGETSKMVHESVRTQFGESQRLVREINEQVGKNLLDVARGLTKLDETNRQVVSFADQLQDLQDILKNPKQRGSLIGEYYLETILKNVLPPGSFTMQYRFGKDEEGGELIADAVVFVKDKIIPIDSKFSLENYNRLIQTRDPAEKERLQKAFVNDLKLRIQETAKYIRPRDNTTDFAFMFIPHEAIYYDLLISKVGAVSEETENLIQRAAGKYRVIIVSPTSFLAYLQTVLQGLKALQIEETAKEIIKRVGDLGRHLKAYEEYFGKLGAALGTAVNHYNSAGREFKRIDKDITRIEGEAPGLEAREVQRPELPA